MTDDLMTMIVVANATINLAVFVIVAPLYNLKGKICVIREMIQSHDRRISAVEDRA